VSTSALVGLEALGLLGRAMLEGAVVRSADKLEGLLYACTRTGEEFLFMFPPVTDGELRAVSYPPLAGRPLTYWDGIALTLMKESLNPPPEPPLDEQLAPYFAHPLRRMWRTSPHNDYKFIGNVDPKSNTPQIQQIDDLLEAAWTTTS
jgi:hypothetical protein